jgi:hypothetical protein
VIYFVFSEVITELESEPMGVEEQDQVEDGEEDEEDENGGEEDEDGGEDEDEPEEDEQDKEDDRASIPVLEARKEQQGDRTGKL